MPFQGFVELGSDSRLVGDTQALNSPVFPIRRKFGCLNFGSSRVFVERGKALFVLV